MRRFLLIIIVALASAGCSAVAGLSDLVFEDQDAGTDADTDADGDTDTDADTDADSDGDTDADTDSDSDTDVDGDADAGNDGGTDTDTGSDAGTDTGCPVGGLLDEATSLCWQVNPSDTLSLSWADAVAYCEVLGLGGFADWHLPDIDELRSTVRGCSGNETGGSCAVSNACLTSSCWGDTTCPECTPGASCYWEDGLEGACDAGSSPGWGGYWTASTMTDDTSRAAIVLPYYGGRPGFAAKTALSNARCVRSL
jgi:hypothetical protein